MATPRLRSLVSNPGYLGFFAAATLARLGNEMVVVGVALFVLERTDSTAAAGATVAAFALPTIVSGPLLGAWLDRRERRLPLIAGDQVVAVVAIAGIAAGAGRVPDLLLPLAALIAGVTAPLSYGAMTTLVPLLSPRTLRAEANALEATSFNLAIVAGPALAGTLVATLGPEAAIAAQGVIKLAALGCVIGMTEPRRSTPARGQPLAETVRAGLRHLSSTKPLLSVTVAGAVGLAGRGLLTLAFPLFALDQLGTGEAFAGYMWAAFAIGSIAGALALTRPLENRSPAHVTVAALALSGALMLLWPIAQVPAVALATIASAGFAYGPGLAATLAVRQDWTPPDLHSRVFMTSASLKSACFGLGALVAAPAITAFGAAGVLVVAAVVQFLAAGAGLALLRAPGQDRPFFQITGHKQSSASSHRASR